MGVRFPPPRRDQSLEEHAARAEAQLRQLHAALTPRADRPPLRLPQLKMTAVRNEFSLADLTDLDPFRALGERIAADPSGALRRVALSARVVQGADGLRQVELAPARALDRVESPATLFPLETLRQQLLDQVLGASIVPARANQRRPAAEIVDAFLRGLGAHAEVVLSGYLDRAAAGLLQLLTEEQRRYASRPAYGEVVELTTFAARRIARATTSQDRFSAFAKGVGYEGYTKSLYAQDWFDSATERDLANILEDEEAIVSWVRLHVGDLPILWAGAREYHPDFIAVDRASVQWLLEVKMDREMASGEVQGKREAARRWANHVSADEQVGAVWRYLLLSESDLRAAKGSWPALQRLGEH